MADDEATPASGAELLARMRASRAEIELLVAPLNEEALLVPGGDGWSLRDHLGHLAFWARSIVSLLRDGNRLGLGITEDEYGTLFPSGGVDAVNGAVLANVRIFRGTSARQLFSEAHAEFDAAVEALGDDALTRTYRSFEVTGPEQPVVGWIIGDSYGHDADHIESMRALAAASR